MTAKSEALPTDASRSVEKQLVTFTVGLEEYAFHIASIREIIRLNRITKLPGTPAFMTGVINLRGDIISIYDLRKILQQPETPVSKNSRIIIVSKDPSNTIGLLVDKVSRVVKIASTSLLPSPITDSEQLSFVDAICRVNSQLIIILGLDKVLDIKAACEAISQGRPENA